MKFKSLFLSALCAMTVIGGFTSCTDDDDSPVFIDVTVADGVFVLNEGSYFAGINGTLDYLDYKTATMSNNILADIYNLGGTPNNAIIVGDVMYIACSDENRVAVIDAKNLIAAKQMIAITAPRELATDGSYLYVTSQAGCVIKVDLTTNLIVETTPVIGDRLEGIAYRDGYLYVCNSCKEIPDPDSGYSTWEYHTNLIKLNAETLAKVSDITVAANPNQIISDGKNLYLASWGDYNQTPATVQQIDENDEVSVIGTGQKIAYDDNKLYIVNTEYDEYWNEVHTYKVLDLKTNLTTDFWGDTSLIFSPGTIGVDPVTHDVFITSYNKDDYGYASYTTNGYMIVYSNTNKYFSNAATKYNTGVGPCTLVFFNHSEAVKK
ncbi:MAG: hypothetical protein IKI16_02515 [Prevotella sp.]|nr:hypothetical protein [Prevotella sp.]